MTSEPFRPIVTPETEEPETATDQQTGQEQPGPVDMRAGLLAALADSDARRLAKRATAAESSRALQAELGLSDEAYAEMLAMPQADFERLWQDQMRAEGFPDLHGPMGQMRAALAKHAGIDVRMPAAPVRPSVLAEAAAGRPELLGALVPGARTAQQVEADEIAAGQARNPDGTFAAQGSFAQAAAGIRAATGRGPQPQRQAPASDRSWIDAQTGEAEDQAARRNPQVSSGSLALDTMRRLMGRR